MPIVAYGYGLEQSAANAVVVGEIVVELLANPDIELEPDLDIDVESTPLDISLEPDLEIEVD